MNHRSQSSLVTNNIAHKLSKLTRLVLITFAAASVVACSEVSNTTAGSGGSNDGATGGAGPVGDISGSNGLVINEVLASGLAVKAADGSLDEPWIELFNGTGETISLRGYKLAITGVENESWEFPDVDIASGRFLQIFGEGHESNSSNVLKTNFPIMGLQSLSLLRADNSVLDRVSDIAFPSNQSWGRYPDGADSSRFHTQPTPRGVNAASADTFSLNCEYMTLSAGTNFALKTSPETAVSWSSSDAIVRVNNQGVMTTTASGVAGEAEPVVVTAMDSSGYKRECNVTVANWKANLSSLTIVGHPRSDFLLDYIDGGIYFTLPGQLHRADDGFTNARRVGNFPPTLSAPVMLKTQYGHFASSGKAIYSTQDFQQWTKELEMPHINLKHGFSHYFNQSNLTEYLYAGEYSVDLTQEHSVHRGINTGSNTQWDTVLNWGPEQDFYDDNSQLDTIRHVHAAVTDPYTGHIYVATGDVDQHSRLYFSNDNGENFKLLAMGSQKYRSLSIWFTERYVYWNMDSERADQHVYRLARSVYNQNNTWPALTPELSSGITTVGVRYLVSASAGGYFPAAVGNFFYETQARALSAGERVYPIEDPQHDYSESVADLTHASQWYHLWVKDQNNEDVLIMATAAEGTEPDLRDNNSRLFGFKERADGSVDVQELLNMPSRTPGQPNRFTQMIPGMQDGEGNIYFRGRETMHRTYKTRLNWVDAP